MYESVKSYAEDTSFLAAQGIFDYGVKSKTGIKNRLMRIENGCRQRAEEGSFFIFERLLCLL